MRHASQKTRAGFTLVELLVVIAIIGVLMALGTSASIMALTTIRRRALKVECVGFEQALMMYESKYGELPPDFTDPAAVDRHLYVRFKGKYAGDMQADVMTNYGIDVASLTPADALVFWLGGLPATPPAPGEPYVPAGFNADNRYPFSDGGSRTSPTYSGFEPERIVWSETQLQYMNSAPMSTPYVYFKSHMVGSGANVAKGYDPTVQTCEYVDPGGTSQGTLVPYWRSESTWYNADGVQIITGGLDGEFSGAGAAPVRNVQTGAGFSQADEDNISNFCSASTIGGDTE